MVLYFSGTGNSRYAASILSRVAGDELLSMNDLMRQRLTEPYTARYAFDSDRPYVFVCPTYCWRIPRVVEQFIRDSRFTGCRKAYFFLTCGSGTGDAARHAEALCRELELEFMGLSSVQMPENFITLFSAPSFDDAQGMLRAAVAPIESAARLIALGKPIEDQNGRSGVTGSRINSLFYKLFVKDKKFTVTDACVSCGLCEQLCPLANIRLEKGLPHWQGNCTQCMACIAACPQNAIEYGSATRKKRRYYLSAEGRQK